MVNPLEEAAGMVLAEMPPTTLPQADPAAILAIIQAVITSLIAACPKAPAADLQRQARLAQRPIFGMAIRNRIWKETKSQAKRARKEQVADDVFEALLEVASSAPAEQYEAVREHVVP